MQSFFYLFTRYLAERAQAQELSTSLFFLSTFRHSTDFSLIETGNVSSPLAMTRSCLTIHSRSLRTHLLSASWPFSRSTVALVPPWVCICPCCSASFEINVVCRYDWCEECTRGQRRHDIPRSYCPPDRAPQHYRTCRCPAHPYDLV